MPSILGPSLLNLAATFVSLAAGFLVSIVNARLLGPAGSGAVAYAMWLVICASTIAGRGLPQTVLRSVAAFGEGDEAWRPLVRRAFSLFLRGLGPILLLFLGYALYRWQANGHAPWVWIATALLFPAYALSAFSIAVAHGRGLFRAAAEATAAGSVLQVPLVFLGAWLIGPAGALLGMLARYLPQALCLTRYVERTPKSDPAALTPDMRRYGRSIWTSDMIEVVLLMRIEYLILGYFLTDASVGYFAAAIVFAGLVTQLTLQLAPAFLVGLSPAEAAPEEREAVYRNAMRLTALLVMPLSAGGAAIAPQLVPLVFGRSFEPAANAAALFLLAALPAGLAVVPWAYLAAREQGRTLLRLTLVSALFLIGALTVVVPLAGVPGAALTRIVAETFALTLLLRAAGAHGGPALPWGALTRTFVASAACGASAFAISSAMPGLGGILLAVPAGVLVFLVAVRLLGLFDAGEVERFMQAAEGRLPAGVQSLARRLAGVITPR